MSRRGYFNFNWKIHSIPKRIVSFAHGIETGRLMQFSLARRTLAEHPLDRLRRRSEIGLRSPGENRAFLDWRKGGRLAFGRDSA